MLQIKENRDLSFSKKDRILKRSEFIRLSKWGKKIHTDDFIILVCKSRYDRTRLGVTVTKKVGNAVKRNRIKRHCREYFRLNKHNITGNWDINIIAKKHAANLPAIQIRRSLEKAFERIS